jgi:PAS domain S-box-containing protein
MIAKEIVGTREILECISQSVIVIDLKGVVMFWNKASEDIFGYSREEMLGRPLSYIYPSIAQEKFEQDLQKLKKGKRIKEQWRSITKDGSIVWIDVQTNPLTDDKGDPVAFIASAYNIQNLKNVEKKLVESKARANAILEATVDGIFTLDEEGYIQDCNAAATEIFGYSKSDLINKNFETLILFPLKEKESSLLCFFEKNGLIDNNEDSYKEMLGRRKDKTLFPLELSMREVKKTGDRLFTVIINDITERRQLEQEILRISEKERKRMGQDLHDGLGQMLTGIGLISQNLANKLEAKGIEEASEVVEISNLVKKADKYAKSLVHGMVHIDIEERGLKKALIQLSEQARKFFNINCCAKADDDLKITDAMTSLNLYRIAQEAISNAVKHGKADNIEIKLSANDDSLTLSVTDDGLGFSATQKSKNGDSKSTGMGLSIMKYRADIMSGTLNVTEQQNKTHLTCTIPLNKSSSDVQ